MQATEVKFVFEPDPDGGYHAYAPELPGLHTEGDRLEQALPNAEEGDLIEVTAPLSVVKGGLKASAS